MIDLLHNYKRLGYTLNDVKNDLVYYVQKLTTISGYNHFQLVLNAIDINASGATIDDVIVHVKNYITNHFLKNDLILADGTRYVNKTIGEIGEELCDIYIKTSGTEMCAQRYFYLYIKWFYHSVDDIVNCILNNSSINDIELVGPRTKEYLDEIGLKNVKKRFGTPNDRNACPLSFNYGHFIVGPPPITINTWGKDIIDKVYHCLNYPLVEYIRTENKWIFARPCVENSGMSEYFPISPLMSLEADIKDSKDVMACLAYDYFLLYMIEEFSNLDVSVVDMNLGVTNMLEQGIAYDATALKMLNKMRYHDDSPSIIGLLNLIY